MDAMKAILSRRSIRKYTKEPISEELVIELLDAAMHAPSSCNTQPWHFIVITERGLLDKIPQFHPYSTMLREAPLAIAVCADLRNTQDELFWVTEKFWIQDCSAATENMLIAAHAKGLGAVWLAIYPLEERVTGLRRLLALPEDVIPLCVVSIGYPVEVIPPEKRYDAEKVHYNQW